MRRRPLSDRTHLLSTLPMPLLNPSLPRLSSKPPCTGKVSTSWPRAKIKAYTKTLTGAVSCVLCERNILCSDYKKLISSGYTVLPPDVAINPTSVSVAFHPASTASNSAPLRLLTNGEPEPNIDEERASEILSEEDLTVVVDLGDGKAEARVWTCDFSHVSRLQMKLGVH